MPSDRFQIAAERAASSRPTEVWLNLSSSEQAAAIYRELRKLDAEFVLAQQHSPAEPPPTERVQCTENAPQQRAECAR
jgi:hypothetical protein